MKWTVSTGKINLFTCKELSSANKYWKTTVSLLIARTPNIHVIPNSGNNTKAAFILELKIIENCNCK